MAKKPIKKAPKPAKKSGFPAPAPTEELPLEDQALPPEDNAIAEAEPIDGEVEETSSGIQKKTEEDTENERVMAEEELNQEIDDNFNLAFDAAREWIVAAKEDIEFKAGNQWDDEDRNRLKEQKRPCLTFNKIKSIVKLITGHFLQNTARIQVSPEGGEDQKFSGVADKLIDHIDDQANLEFNLGYQFAGGQTTGRTWIELHMDYQNDPIFGHLKSIYHGKPGIIFPDPRGSSYDINEDRLFLFKLTKKTKGELKDMYPDKEEAIEEIGMDTENPATDMSEEGDANNYGLDKRSTTIGLNKSAAQTLQKQNIAQWHVKEYWRFKHVDKWFVYFVDKGDTPSFDSEEEAQAEIQRRQEIYIKEGFAPENWSTVIRKRKKKEMHVAIRCGGVVLADGKSPHEPHYSGFPFFQYIADWTPEAEKDVDAVQGIVRCMKDAQREKNKARSQFLHIINTAANSGWIADSDAMEESKFEELKTFGSTPGLVIRKKQGSTVQRIDPTPAPMAQQVREKAADDSFKEVTGVNSDLLSVDDSANPSGKAIALRIRQAITILEPDFKNFRYTKRLLGTAIMKMAPTLFDVPKIRKILGESYMQNEGIDEVFLKAFLIQIEDLKYNVRIAEQGDTKTMREETFDDLMKMVEKGMPIPFEVLADFMTLPNKQEIMNKVQAYQQQQMMAQAAAQGAPARPAAA